MGIEKPEFKFEPNVNATIRDTRTSGLYADVPKGGEIRVRFAPKSGSLWTKAVNHYGFKREDDKGGTIACLNFHGTEATGAKCFICALVDYLSTADTKVERKLSQGLGSLASTENYYAQVWVYEDDGEGGAIYTGPKLLRLPKTGAERVGEVLDRLVNVQSQPHFADPENGQDLIIRNAGKGLPAQRYSAMETAKIYPLAEIDSMWQEKLIADVYARLALRIYSPLEQYQIAREKYADEINWDRVAEEVEVPNGE